MESCGDFEIDQYHYHLSKILTSKNAREGMRKFGKYELILCCDIENFETIPETTKWGHPFGIVIGKYTRIGEHCIIRQCTTLGVRHPNDLKFPTIGNYVDVGANVTIIGDITVGDNVVIGAGSFINKDIPSNSIVYNKKELVIREKK